MNILLYDVIFVYIYLSYDLYFCFNQFNFSVLILRLFHSFFDSLPFFSVLCIQKILTDELFKWNNRNKQASVPQSQKTK